MERKARTILLNGVRLDVKKKSGLRRSVFFLTPFIELLRWDEKAALQRDAIRSQ
jgi:hypothetical protein